MGGGHFYMMMCGSRPSVWLRRRRPTIYTSTRHLMVRGHKYKASKLCTVVIESIDAKTQGALPSALACSYMCSHPLVLVLKPFVLKGMYSSLCTYVGTICGDCYTVNSR